MTVEDIQEFSKSANRYLYSALAGALAGGGMGALTSVQGAERPGETDEERRNRIIRNALGMGLAGGAAGAAIPGVHDLMSSAAPGRTAFEDFIHKHTTRTGTAALGAAVGAGTGYRSPVGVAQKLQKIEADLLADQARHLGYGKKFDPKLMSPGDLATARGAIRPQMSLHQKDLLGGVNSHLVRKLGIGAGLGYIAPEIAGFVTKDPGYTAAAGTGLGALLTPGSWKRKLTGAGAGGLASYLFGLANEQTRPQK